MKLSRDWLSDHLDLSGLSDEELATRFTEIGHAVESVEKHGDDTVFDLEITTNRVDAMSHVGMARELAAALGRELRGGQAPSPVQDSRGRLSSTIRIDAPEMCSRYTGIVIRGVNVKPSSAKVRARLEAVGLRPINNVVDATNYVMLDFGHPLHAFDLDKLTDKTIIVRRGSKGEKMRSLDGETREIDPNTVVIADAKRAVALGGIIGGAESEIGDSTRNVLLECAWFDPGTIRRTARRIGIKTDASYRFERRVDSNDTIAAAEACARMIVENAGGNADAPIDVIAVEHKPATIKLRAERLSAASGGVVSIAYAFDLFRRLGFGVKQVTDGLDVTVPTYRGDIHEEMDLIEEVLRFFGYNNVPASLPRLTTGDLRPNVLGDTEDAMRQVLVGCGIDEVVNYSFIHPEFNALFSTESPIAITNALTENVSSMRLSIIPGLLENVAYNRSYGTRDGALFEVGRAYHRSGSDKVREIRETGIVMFGSTFDFFDAKGVVEQVAARLHVSLSFAVSDTAWLRKGKRAVARHGDRVIAHVGFLSQEILSRFGIKGDVLAIEIDTEALLASVSEWKMEEVARFPGIPMILALTHGGDLEYDRLISTIRSLDVPYLQEVGLRDRFVPEGENTIKTTLGMWYQAFDRSLTQDEVGKLHQQLAARVADLLPIKLVGA
ncbi:MAG TPA: phenylalanine--tRNA ligase subunit beta [Thermoanaerobaculia bacterium]|nr:phenylalanine--tRNA ligase subunit beta [Thermoanaerobaculia bacterium]